MGMGGRVSACSTTGFSSTQITGSSSDRGFSYVLRTSSLLSMYSASHFPPHRPTSPSLWRRRADHGDNALLLLLIKSRSLARTSGIKQRSLQSAIKIPLADLPHRLGGKSKVGAHRRRGLPLIQLPQGQGAQGRAYPLQPASQQLIYLLSIALLEFNLKSYTSAHASDIQPEPAPNKCLLW